MVLSIADFYTPERWTLGFWEWGPDYTIVKNRHIGLDIGTGRRPIDVPCLYGGRVIIVTKTRSMGWVVVIDTGLLGNRRYHAYCHLSAHDLPRPRTVIGRGGRVGRLAAGPKGVAYDNPDYPGTAWGGIHLHLVMCDVAHGAYTLNTGASFANPEVFIREALSGSAAGGNAQIFDPEEDDLNEKQDFMLNHLFEVFSAGIPGRQNMGPGYAAVIESRDNAKAAYASLRKVEPVVAGPIERAGEMGGTTSLAAFLAWADQNNIATRRVVVETGASIIQEIAKNSGVTVDVAAVKRAIEAAIADTSLNPEVIAKAVNDDAARRMKS